MSSAYASLALLNGVTVPSAFTRFTTYPKYAQAQSWLYLTRKVGCEP